MPQNNLHATLGDPEMESCQHNVSVFSQMLSRKSNDKENIAFETQLHISQSEVKRSKEEWKTVTSKLEVSEQEFSKAMVMTDKAFEVLESKICSLELDLSKAREENNRLATKMEFGSNVIAEVAQPQCLRNKHQTEINSLKATVDDLELRLKDVQLSNHDKAAELEHLKEATKFKHQNLLATVQDSEDSRNSLIMQNTFISDKLAKSEFEKEGLKAKISNLEAEIEDLEENEKILNKNIESTTAIEAKLESLKAKNKNLLATAQEAEDSRTSLIKRNTFINDKLAKSGIEKEVLKAKISNLQAEVEATKEFRQKEIFRNVQNESMVDKVAELESLTAKQQQSICDLKVQLEMKQEENIHACIFAENTDSSENQRNYSLLVNVTEDLTDETTPEDQTDLATLEDSAAEVQTRTCFWFRRVTSVLKVGLRVAFGIMGALLVTGVTQMLNDMTGSSCFQLESHCNMQNNLFSLHYIRPPPF